VLSYLAAAVLEDEVDIELVLEITVKLDNVGMIQRTMKFDLAHYLHTQNQGQLSLPSLRGKSSNGQLGWGYRLRRGAFTCWEVDNTV